MKPPHGRDSKGMVAKRRPTTFGAPVHGYYEGTRLKYAGRVGSGFGQPVLERMLEVLGQLQSGHAPFPD